MLIANSRRRLKDIGELMRKGFFITVEGTDGSGKSTQFKLIKEYLESRSYEVVCLREPGGTYIGEKVRELTLDPENSGMDPVTEMLLYASSRAQLVSEIIAPSLEEDKIVLCDRYVDSSMAYQGFGRGIPLEYIKMVNDIATRGIQPDITLFFDVEPCISMKRINANDRMEMECEDFHTRVYEGYRKLSNENAGRIKSFDCCKSIDEVFAEVRKVLEGIMQK